MILLYRTENLCVNGAQTETKRRFHVSIIPG